MAGRVHNLPVGLTPFIGREKELVELQARLSVVRHLTLVGPGGCGKTRLALEGAAALAATGRYGDGVWFVDLAPIQEEALVTPAVMRVLGLRQVASAEPEMALLGYLEPRQTLLLLDNCEHLLPACAALVARLLQHCPRVRVLATSREALRCTGETTWLLPMLPLPDTPATQLGTLAANPAVRLFLTRAQTFRASLTLTAANASLVVEICRRLEGVPLALELAAARVNVMSLAQIAARLGDALALLSRGPRTAAARQQTLEATLAWSYDLLSDEEKAAWRWLAVFGGDFSLAAAEAILAAMGVNDGAADLLFLLTEKSLVQLSWPEGLGRYRLLETLRQYGQKLQSEAERALLAAAHSRYYRELALRLAPQLYGPGRNPLLAQLEAERDQLRAVIGRDLAAGQGEAAAELAGALWWFWWQRGYWGEGRGWLSQALDLIAAPDLGPPAPSTVLAHLAGGVLAWAQADHEAALSQLALSYHNRFVLDAQTQGYASLFFSATHLGLNELPAARQYGQAAVAHFAAMGPPAGHYLALANEGIIAMFQGDFPAARRLLEMASAGLQQIGDLWAAALPLRNLGYIAYLEESYEEAERLQLASLASLQGQGDKWFASRSLELLAETTAMLGLYERAATLFGASVALREAVGAAVLPYYQGEYELGLARVESSLSERVLADAWQRGRRLTVGDWEAVIDFALSAQAAAPPPAVGLRLMALGPAAVERDGQRLARRDWGYFKPRELLFYLLVAGPQSKETIGLALWPEASEQQLRGRLHRTLHQLRKVLGRPACLPYRDGLYSWEPASDCWSDLAYYREVEAAAAAEYEADPGRAITLLSEVTALYRGPLLADFTAAWVDAPRAEWAQRQGAALLRLGGWQLAAGQAAVAAATFGQAIAHDELDEAAHRGLLRSLLAAGKHAQAQRHYNALVDLLAAELGVDPAPETTALIQRPA